MAKVLRGTSAELKPKSSTLERKRHSKSPASSQNGGFRICSPTHLMMQPYKLRPGSVGSTPTHSWKHQHHLMNQGKKFHIPWTIIISKYLPVHSIIRYFMKLWNYLDALDLFLHHDNYWKTFNLISVGLFILIPASNEVRNHFGSAMILRDNHFTHFWGCDQDETI